VVDGETDSGGERRRGVEVDTCRRSRTLMLMMMMIVVVVVVVMVVLVMALVKMALMMKIMVEKTGRWR